MPLKIYLAARYAAKTDVEQLAVKLRRLGYIITSRWHEPTSVDVPYCKATKSVMTREAIIDLTDLKNSNTLIACEIFGDKGSRGARHCEFGYALAKNFNLIIFGHRWHCFHFLPNTKVTKNYKQLLQFLRVFDKVK